MLTRIPGRKHQSLSRCQRRRLSRFWGWTPGREEIVRTLSSLGFACQPGNAVNEIKVTAAYWRSDIHLEVDLIEEVARIIGYDKIPLTTLCNELPRQNPEPFIRFKRSVRERLAGFGFQEIVSNSLTNLEMLGKLMPEPHALAPVPLRVVNPMTEDQECLRTTLRAGLLAALVANRRFEEGGIRLFELGKIYLPKPDDLPDEPDILTGIIAGTRDEKSWNTGDNPVDFYDAKGVAEGLLGSFRVKASFLESRDESLAPGKRADIAVDEVKLGVVGEVHPRVLAAFEIPEPVYLFELDLKALLPYAMIERPFQTLSRFPSVPRDMALVLGADVANENVKDIITSFPLVTGVSLFDVYAGKQVLPGKKSLAYRIIFQSADHTLTEEEVNAVQERILKRLAETFGATLRT
ncbi:MAG: phenylalanine--tRNA ligase subunit beta [Chloroflexota bacterium]